eukprot:gene39399-47961_t
MQAILYELLPLTFNDVEGMYKGSIVIFVDLGRLVYHIALGTVNWWRTKSWVFIVSFALWIVGLVGANYFEVATLYICASIFVSMLMNLSTRREGELSAYSVFNTNFERLMGTLTAEQFDAEIRHQMPMDNNNAMPMLGAADEDDVDDDGGIIEDDDQKLDKQTLRAKKRELKLGRDLELKKIREEGDEADRKYLERLVARQNFMDSVQTKSPQTY